ncbi:helix-hairpin-helix domain-containing protein [Marinobacter hydrocarbonoclasticus]|nr:helix-hairpin-helix domain-containing protein [Marinobacter nauticus]
MWKALMMALAIMMTPLVVWSAEIPQEVEQASPVNINTAEAEILADALTGIGLQKAQAIVDYRNEHGPFQTKDDLLKVPGIGKQLLTRNLDRIGL